MSRLGSKSMVFHGDFFLGEVEISPNNQNFQFPNNEIRINHISQPSERCPPLSILQTISPFSVRCKLKSSSTAEKTHLSTLYFTCLNELKSAVVLLGGEELHLVAMPSKQEKLPCFWCCSVPMGIYGSILGMLNLRCLAIVFDLDETLIVANTMKSFEDRIEFLQKKLEVEHDPLRVSGMSAELRRYVEDRLLLKQYLENDNVIDNGKVFNIQFEEVQSLSNEQVKIVRPVIRLKERNIVLTRINPEIRDTSVLVRLRPAWEDLRSYLNAKGRKRFEVYVCTMAERDYALEMWRLLDPEAHLISPNQLLNRVVCVKSGARKSLSGVFQDGMCHPKMAMVIDDRLKVWEDNDQPRVHVVPAFTPYYAPQAETANAVPVLCVARNVACNVRAGYFKEYDENLLRRIFELCYEDEVANLPFSPDVSDFIMPEDTIFVPNGNRDVPIPEGMHGAEVERRMNKSNEMHTVDSTNPIQPVSIAPPVVSPETSRINTPLPSTESTSEVDSDKRRRLLIMQHGADIREQNPPAPTPPIQSSGGWLVDEDSSTMDVDTNGTTGLPHKTETIPTVTSSHESEVKGDEPSLFADKEHGKVSIMPPYIFIGVLQEIGRRCGSKIEFRSIVSTSKDLQFSVEVLFSGEKIGIGMGKTKKDAQQQAAENALRTLADEYVAYVGPDSGSIDKVLVENNNGFLWEEPGDKNGNVVQ